MTLTLSYNAKTTVPVEVEGITPQRLREMRLAEIENLEIFHGNEKLPLAQMFALSGNASDGRLVWEGDLGGVHWIGAGMSEGEIHISGNAGRHIGSEMTGGEIHVAGDAGDWVGGEIHGGLIHVRGRAGHLIGAAYRGSAIGMTGGTILIDGDVGNEIGHTMRRGLLAVGGQCGDAPGFNMIAGSIFVFGDSGIRPGASMRRGTIALLGQNPPKLLPTFRRGRRCHPPFLSLIYAELKRRGFPLAADILAADVVMYHGDMVELGKGEILLRA